jgi:carbonic anhydrase
MRKYTVAFLTLFLIFNASLVQADNSIPLHKRGVNALLKNIFNDNEEYVYKLSYEHFNRFPEQQSPRATIVACSDSRVQSSAFHKSPVNDLFFIRDIGNQIVTSEGSVDFGVNHLKTPVLIIIGHSACGAIHARLGDYSKESPATQRELNNLQLSEKKDVNKAVVENVNRQVAYAMERYKDKVAKEELVVVGAIYDFRDDFHKGEGRLILVNLNGEKDPTKIKSNDYLKGIKSVPVGE